jgi:hypothetical protein
MGLLYRGRYSERFESVCALIRENDRAVLELCFGDVAVAARCRQRGVCWTGLDLSEAFVAHAVKLGFDARQADLLRGEALPACDLCVMMGSLYHFERNLPELFARVKRSSARFVLSEPVRNWTHAGGLRRYLAMRLTRAGARDEVFRFTEASLTQALDRLRLDVGFEYRVVSVAHDMIVEVVWSS